MSESKTCEVEHGYAFGDDVGEDVCGKPAKLMLNGFPCCEECFVGYEAEGLVEKWDWLSSDDPAPDTLGAMVRCGACPGRPTPARNEASDETGKNT